MIESKLAFLQMQKEGPFRRKTVEIASTSAVFLYSRPVTHYASHFHSPGTGTEFS